MKAKNLEIYFYKIYYKIYNFFDIIFGGLVLYSYWNKGGTKLLDQLIFISAQGVSKAKGRLPTYGKVARHAWK